MRAKLARIGAVVITGLFLTRAHAQTVDLWPGAAPGSEKWSYVERRIDNPANGGSVVNVVKPTVTAYLPPRGKASGTGVIIAPGGAFVALDIDREGHDVARWLQQKGIAAFVLKYRLMEQRANGGMPSMPEMDEAGKYAAADGIQAMKVVRRHAAEWGVSPEKVGFIGFSAGATVATSVLLSEDAAVRPDFVGLLYGGPFGGLASVPAQLPPLFLAWAQDDPISAATVAKVYDALKAAGQKPEAHVFTSGGHAFGMRKKGSTSDHWIEEFYFWLEAQGLTQPAVKHAH